MADKALAEKLRTLCCAETEGKFFDCVTDNIQAIIEALDPPEPARDPLGRLVDPTAMPEHIKDAVASSYGMLWAVHTDDVRVHLARRGLLQWLTKDEQARGIDMARGVMLMRNRELVDPPTH